MVKKEQGFTLMELMTVIAILGVLTAIGYPAYQQYVVKAHRADAHTALTDASFLMESCRSDRATYTGCEISPETEFNYYTISLEVSGSGNYYLLTATPVESQTRDTDCGALTLNSHGQKGSEGGGRSCWPK